MKVQAFFSIAELARLSGVSRKVMRATLRCLKVPTIPSRLKRGGEPVRSG
jgi:hypothetical protein